MTRIDWSKWSAIAEILGTIAVFVTLLYLATQTRQNTLAIQASVRQAMVSEETQLLFRQMEYPFVAPSYPSRDLTPEEEVQRQAWLAAFFRDRENQWLQFRSGVIDEATWATYRWPMKVILSVEYNRFQWQTGVDRGEFAQGFVDDINTFISSSPPLAPPPLAPAQTPLAEGAHPSARQGSH